MSYFLKKIKLSAQDSDVEAGFGLIDVLFGILLTGFSAFFLMAFSQASQTNHATTTRTQAIYLAQEALEELKQNDGKFATDQSLSWSTAKKSINKSNTTYTISIAPLAISAINDAPNNLDDFLKPYQVTVSWIENGHPKSIEITNYYYLR